MLRRCYIDFNNWGLCYFIISSLSTAPRFADEKFHQWYDVRELRIAVKVTFFGSLGSTSTVELAETDAVVFSLRTSYILLCVSFYVEAVLPGDVRVSLVLISPIRF